MIQLLAALSLLLPAPARALSGESDKLILDGLDRLYSLDLDTAEREFREVMLKEPQEPAGPFFLASLYWVQYTQTFDVLEGGGTLQDRFEFYARETIQRAQAKLKSDPNDAEAYFWLGGVWGMRGWWKVLQRHWVEAARLGFKGYRYLLKAVKLKPDLADAYLGLGIYDYYAQTLPRIVRIFSSFLFPGDKARGLRYITTTIQAGHYSKIEARLFLIGIYTTEEKRYRKALGLVRELRREKPGNAYFGLLEMNTLMHLKDFSDAAQEGDALIAQIKQRPQTALQDTLFYLYAGEAYQGLGRHEQAVAYFTRGIQASPDPHKATVTYCYLRRAQSYDMLARRLEAVQDYRKVIHRRDYFDSVATAKKGLRGRLTPAELLKELTE